MHVECNMRAVRDMRALPGCIACHALLVRDMRAYPFWQAFSTLNVCSAWHALSVTHWVRDIRAVCDLRAARDMRSVGPYICLLPQSFSPTGQWHSATMGLGWPYMGAWHAWHEGTLHWHAFSAYVCSAWHACSAWQGVRDMRAARDMRVTRVLWAINMPATTQLLSQWDSAWMGWWWQGMFLGAWHACSAFHAPSTANHDNFFPVHCVNWCHWRNFG